MKYQRGFIAPLLVLVGLAIIGAGLYYYSKDHPEEESSPVATTSTSTTVYYTTATSTATTTALTDASSGGYTDTSSSSAAGVAYRTVQRQVTSYVPVRSPGVPNAGGYASYNNSALVQIGATGVMPQRLGWLTYTDIPFSFAISRPSNWSLAGGNGFVSESDGHAVVSVQGMNITPGTDVNTFAVQNGAAGGLLTTQVNAYTALQSNQGANTVYYIVNGAVGYKISVSNNLTPAESEIVRAILIEFTVTKQR